MNRQSTIYAALAVTVAISALAATPSNAQSPALRLSTLMLNAPQGSADDEFNAGVDLQDAGKFADAIKKYTSAISKRKTFTDAYLNRGICYIETKEYDKAIEDFNFYIMRKPAVGEGYINRAQAYTEKKQYAEAVKDYETALSKNPKGPEMNAIYLNRAATYYGMGDYDKAIADWGSYITAAGAKVDPIVFLNRGLAYMNKARDLTEKKDEAGATAQYGNAVKDFTDYVAKKPDDTEGFISRAEAYIGAKQFDKAIADLTAYTAKKTDDPVAYALRAQAYLGLNPPKSVEASADIDKALAKDPSNPAFAGLRLQLAGAKYKNKDYKGAIDEATKLLAVQGQSKNKLALTIRASAYSDMAGANAADTASLANAIKDYDVLLTIDPADATSLRNRGVAYYRLKQYDKAIVDFDGFIKAKPSEPDGYNFKALAYMQMQPPQYPKAIEAYNGFLAKKPGDTIALYNRGLAYFNTMAYDKALPDFQAAAKDEKHPNAKEIPGYVADCLIKLGKSDEAEKAYTAAITNNPKDGEAFLSRGALRLGFAAALKEDDPNRKTKLQAALADFNQAVPLMPNQIEPLLNRSLTYFKLGQWTESITDATAALKIKPDNPDALITRADASYNAANAKKDKTVYAAAIADYTKYMALPGLKPEQVKSAAEGLALAAAGSGDYTAAINAYNGLIAKDPANTSALLGRGLAYYNAKQYDKAVTDFDAYIAKDANNPQGYLYRGLAFKATNAHDKAAADFEKSFSIKPDFAAANNAGEEYLAVGNAQFDPDPDKAYAAFEKAIALFDKATTAKADSANTYYNKGVALVQKARAGENKTTAVDPAADYKAAIVAYEKYLQLAPTATDKAEVQKIIAGLKEKAG